MKENKLVDLSTDFAVKIIKLCETIRKILISSFKLQRKTTKNKNLEIL